MSVNITMPALSPTMEEGTLAKWLKSEGDMVEAGDVIAEIETDKATMEVEAVDEGILGKIVVAGGTEGVKVNAVIAVLLDEGEDVSSIDMTSLDAVPKAVKIVEDAPKDDKSTKEVAKELASVKPAVSGARIFATPLAKRIAKDKNIDLAQVSGTGPNGRIVKADILGFKGSSVSVTTSKASSAPASSGPDAKALADMLGMEYEEIPNNGIKKIVASRLVESKQTVPHFYLTVECQIDALMVARKEINDAAKGAYKISVNDFVIKAVAQALKVYPAANVAWTDDAVLQYKHADISVAVATPNGLITPIVKAAETKGLQEISAEIKDLAGRAREGKLKPEEFQGGTFSVSNLGMFGVKEFDAIINPPQACILAIGAGAKQPYVDGNDVKIGTFMNCTLSVDHRAVDGAVGAEYLQYFKRFIENPVSMLV
ncbi:MAG: pyruvate dehydrogenase complex dihydrolipoamide acetyltransferase [Alphaproteobacteria bacterium]|nr:pyruvate dehydrogenase complex dihydrolipoamide acetyltransferase [Alphaproteobacteria bacterium]